MPDGYEVVANYKINRKTLEITEVPEPMKLRPAVQWFAEQMELRLRQNDHKESLPRPTMEECVDNIQRYWADWKHENYRIDVENDPVRVRWNLVNMANWFLLMIGKDVNEK